MITRVAPVRIFGPFASNLSIKKLTGRSAGINSIFANVFADVEFWVVALVDGLAGWLQTQKESKLDLQVIPLFASLTMVWTNA